MKAYKVELLIIDFEGIGPEEIKLLLEDGNYPNDCLSPKVKFITERDIGEFSDNHPLNCNDTYEKEYKRLFEQNSKD